VLLHHLAGDRRDTAQVVAGEGASGRRRQTLIVGQSGLTALFGDWATEMSTPVLLLEDGGIEVLHEARDLVGGQHQIRDDRIKQEFRCDQQSSSHHLSNRSIGSSEAANDLADTNPVPKLLWHCPAKIIHGAAPDRVWDPGH
jgi:hypothetical protein